MLRRVLGIDAKNYAALSRLGVVCENEEESLEYYRRASIVRPDCWRMRYNMGYSLNELGRYEEALEMFAEARKLCEENPSDVSAAMGECHISVKNYDRSKAEAERALVEDPTNEEAEELLEKVSGSVG